MDPEPLVGIAADVVFENLCKQLSIRNDVGFAVFGAHQLHRGIEAQPIFLQARVPNGESRNHGGISLQRNSRHPTRGARGVAEEVHEDALLNNYVGVHEDADGFAVAHGSDKAAGEILVDGFIAVHGAIAAREPVKIRIVERAHYHVERMSVERVRKGGQLPRAQVSGEKQHTFAASQRALVVFESLIDNGLADVLARVSREQANLGDVASEGCKDTVKNLLAFCARLLRKSEFEIPHTDAAQLPMQQIDEPRDGDAGGASQRPGQCADQLDENPRQRVFESVAQTKAKASRGQKGCQTCDSSRTRGPESCRRKVEADKERGVRPKSTLIGRTPRLIVLASGQQWW